MRNLSLVVGDNVFKGWWELVIGARKKGNYNTYSPLILLSVLSKSGDPPSKR